MGETKTGVAHASLTYYRRCSGATSDSSSTLGLGQGIYLSIYLGINSWLLLLLLQLLLRPIISRLSSREVQTAVVQSSFFIGSFVSLQIARLLPVSVSFVDLIRLPCPCVFVFWCVFFFLSWHPQATQLSLQPQQYSMITILLLVPGITSHPGLYNNLDTL